MPTCVVDGNVITENVGIMSYFAGGYPRAGIWPKDTWHQSLAISTMAWLSNTVHAAYGHLVRPARYVDGEDHQAAVKEKARASYEGYLREIPVDPITNSKDTWQTVNAEPDATTSASQVGIYDVKSGSELQAMDGTNYADWD